MSSDKIIFCEKTGLWRNLSRAQRVIDFIENLIIPSGVGAGGLFKLREWQKKFIRDIYEPIDYNFEALVREAIQSIARKNGKTALIAALVLVHLVGPEAVTNGEIYSAANDREQAARVFLYAAQLVRADPELDADEGGLLRVVDSTYRIVCPSNGSFYRALSRDSKTKHGLNPTFVVYDELAQAIDRELYDALNTADGARDNFLFVVISTQSKDPSHILSELIDRGLDSDDPSVVCHLYAVDEDLYSKLFCENCVEQFDLKNDEENLDCPKCGGDLISAIYDEREWIKANPALGDFKLLKSMRKRANQARRIPSFEPTFRNLELNERVDSIPSLISGVDWKACLDKDCELIPGEEIYIGLDLSSTTDLCALVAVSAKNGDRVKSWCWKPAALVDEHAKRDRVPYKKWADEGFLNLAPGKVIDYDWIVQHFVFLDSNYTILGVAFDRWRMLVLFKCFENVDLPVYLDNDGDEILDGIRFVEWGQGFKDMGPAVDALENSILSGTLKHDGHPVLTWCFSNAVAVLDPAGNRKIDKSKARFRIDLAVAGAMAIGLKARDMLEEKDDIDDFLNGVITASVA